MGGEGEGWRAGEAGRSREINTEGGRKGGKMRNGGEGEYRSGEEMERKNNTPS